MEEISKWLDAEALFQHFHLIAIGASLLLIPLLVRSKFKELTQSQEKLREIAVRLGLHLHTPFQDGAQGQRLDTERVMSSLPKELQSKNIKKEDLARALERPLVQRVLQLAQPWEMVGRIANTDVCAKRVSEGGMLSIHFHASFATPLGFEIAISPEDAVRKVGKFLISKMQDIQTGDAKFDTQLFVRGSDAVAIQNWLAQGSRKTVLLDFFAAHPTASLDPNGLNYIYYGEQLDSEVFRKTFESLASTVHQLAR